MLRQLYLDDLAKTVDYGSGERARVHNLQLWKSIQPHSKTGIFLDLEQELENKKVWLISDLHLGHNNIIKYCNRPFKSVDEMNESLIQNIQDIVGPGDICIFVGDISFMETSKANALLSRCPGYKILVIGNHDFNKGKLRNLDFDEIHLCLQLQYKSVTFALTHYPLEEMPFGWRNIHGHVHDKSLDSINHINVSCEVLDYKPVLLSDIYSAIPKWTKEQIEQINEAAEKFKSKFKPARTATD